MTDRIQISKGDQIVITRSHMGAEPRFTVHASPQGTGVVGASNSHSSLEEVLAYIRETYAID